MAIIGLWTLGLASITVASSTAPLASRILVRWSLDVEAVLTQFILVILLGSSLSVGLAARSRVAFGLSLAIGVVAVAWWIDLFVSADPVAAHRLAVLVGASGLLVLAGLVLDWAAFWRSPDTDPDDGTPVSPRHAGDRAWRPPR